MQMLPDSQGTTPAAAKPRGPGRPKKVVEAASPSEVIEIDNPADTRVDDARAARDRFVEKVLANRNKPVEEYTPPPMSPRMQEQTRLEMEAGRTQVNANKEAARPVPKRDPADGTMTPVYRPKDYVPSMVQGETPTRTHKVM